MRSGWFTTLLLVGLLPQSARAHAPDFDWKQIGAKIAVEAFFDDGTPIVEAKVRMLDAKSNVMASGVTDREGKCTLEAPNPGNYQLLLDAGAGHRKQRAIAVVGTLPVADGQPKNTEPVTKEQPAVPGARRAEVTRFPWERAAIGCGVIALVGAAWWWSRRVQRAV